MKIINANIYHSRLGPKINTFTYRANYFEFDFFENKHINEFKILSINKFNLLSVDENDYCLGEDKSLFGWVCSLCKDKSNQKIDKIKLITMPKVLGYVFNPVSFIFCYQNEEICSLILKVNNTFNESHFYYLDTKYKQNLNMEKVFHVSPFLKREGYYKVDFNNTENKFKVIINYYDTADNIVLKTGIIGDKIETSNIFFLNILSFFKVIFYILRVQSLIHIQALKLWIKKIEVIKKPKQKREKIT